jgi:SAM-dependent methyltransferase
MGVFVERRDVKPHSSDAEADRGPSMGSEASAGRPDFYERYWEDADHHFEYNFEAATRHRFPSICRVWGSLRSPGRVLDWGCGNGVLTYWMYENGFGSEVLGVDVSQTAVAYANERFARIRSALPARRQAFMLSSPHCCSCISARKLDGRQP